MINSQTNDVTVHAPTDSATILLNAGVNSNKYCIQIDNGKGVYQFGGQVSSDPNDNSEIYAYVNFYTHIFH